MDELEKKIQDVPAIGTSKTSPETEINTGTGLNIDSAVLEKLDALQNEVL